MSRDRERAERCFALARSTTFDGERDSAIARGVAIAEKAGLDLDTFDIPGRSKAKRQGSGRCFMCGGEAAESRFGAPCYRCSPSPKYARSHEYGRPGGGATSRPFYGAGTINIDPATMAQFREAMAGVAASFAKAGEAMRRANFAPVFATPTPERLAKLADVVADQLWPLGWKVYRVADTADGKRGWMVTTPNGTDCGEVDDIRLCRFGASAGPTVQAAMRAELRRKDAA